MNHLNTIWIRDTISPISNSMLNRTNCCTVKVSFLLKNETLYFEQSNRDFNLIWLLRILSLKLEVKINFDKTCLVSSNN